MVRLVAVVEGASSWERYEARGEWRRGRGSRRVGGWRWLRGEAAGVGGSRGEPVGLEGVLVPEVVVGGGSGRVR